jgi:hypothetical protein
MVLRTTVRCGLAAAGLTLLLVGSLPATSLAQPRETAEVKARREQAGKLADEGFDLLKNKRYEEALDKFRTAESTLHSPMFVLFQARAEEGRGRLVEAQKLMQRVIDERLPDYAPENFWQAKQEAKQAIAELAPRVPSLTLKLRGAEPATTSVPVEEARSGSPFPVNPGRHKVVATAADGRQLDKVVTVAESEKAELELDLSSVPVGPAQPETPEGDGDRAWLAPGIAFGIGGASLLVGAITGGVFVSRANALKARCPDNQCSPEDEEEGNAVSTLGTVSTVTLVLGGVGVVAGIVFVFVPLDGSSEPPSSEATASTMPELGIGPSGLHLRGRF